MKCNLTMTAENGVHEKRDIYEKYGFKFRTIELYSGKEKRLRLINEPLTIDIKTIEDIIAISKDFERPIIIEPPSQNFLTELRIYNFYEE